MQEKRHKFRLTVRHCKAARALLDWTAAELAEKAGVNTTTVHSWENRRHEPRQATRDAIQKAFEDAGIEFSNGNAPGVKLYLEVKNATDRGSVVLPTPASSRAKRTDRPAEAD